MLQLYTPILNEMEVRLDVDAFQIPKDRRAATRRPGLLVPVSYTARTCAKTTSTRTGFAECKQSKTITELKTSIVESGQ